MPSPDGTSRPLFDPNRIESLGGGRRPEHGQLPVRFRGLLYGVALVGSLEKHESDLRRLLRIAPPKPELLRFVAGTSKHEHVSVTNGRHDKTYLETRLDWRPAIHYVATARLDARFAIRERCAVACLEGSRGAEITIAGNSCGKAEQESSVGPQAMPYNGPAHNLRGSPGRVGRETTFYARFLEPRSPSR